ncbi:2Fe-2S iron-sulfur cluster-binding protein [Aquincola sp. MAHUQ-54]|uniref:2Fe-2S iron-sulfur cluster-binding protein n=1 Tax=Aquincola agrisoli TaxID=3119538 RepID=A0AAW9QNB7_9BURK
MPPADDPAPLPRCHTVQLAPAGPRYAALSTQTLLAAALQAGLPLRSACRNGTCRACLSRLIEGEVHYVIDWPGLSADERRDGCVLPCVAQPRSDVVLQPGSASWG